MGTAYIIVEDDENYSPTNEELFLDNSDEVEYTTPYTDYGDDLPNFGNDLNLGGVWDDR